MGKSHYFYGKIHYFDWENPTISMGKSTISIGSWFQYFFVSLPEAKSQSLMLTMEFPIFPGEVNV
jgi:hypothetical protein